MSRRILIYSAILLLGVLTVLYFGAQKQGFHEDELYSFYSSNRTAGIAWPDREWMDTARLTDEMVVLPDEGFRYGLVRTVQSWDVHPPLYYDLLHTACSLFPGTFSKWLGIGVNLAAFVLCFLLLLAICCECRLSHRFTALFLLLWAIHPLTVSAAIFIRMYLWLTVFVLACLLLHLRMLRGYTKLRMAGIMAVSFLGFLTHYYYLIFFFFAGVTLSLLWFLQKTGDTAATEVSARVSRIVRYAAFCAASLAAAVLVYPASLAHIFRGYRGKEAAGAFFSLSGWGGRLAFFGGLTNEYLFSGALGGVMLLYLVLAVIGGKKERQLQTGTILVGAPTLLYFFVVSMTALLLGATSNRYLMPVDPLLLLLVLSAGDYLLRQLNRNLKPDGGAGEDAYLPGGRVPAPRHRRALFRWRMLRAAMFAMFFGLFLFLDLSGLFLDDHVLFLYPENAEAVETARRDSDIPAVILYNEETPENIWRLYDKLAAFSDAYYMDAAAGMEETADGAAREARLTGSEELFVFAADTDENIDRDARISEIMRRNPALTTREIVWRQDMWTWYRLR